MRTSPLLLALFTSASAVAQDLSPQVVATNGGSGTVSGVSLQWTLGEFMNETLWKGPNYLTQGFHQGELIKVQVNMRALLDGPYLVSTGLMIDSLRTQSLIPLSEPYTALGFYHVDGGGETTTAPVLAITGPDAIIDWVVVELRHQFDDGEVMATASALLQRDGDVVAEDGISPVQLKQPAGSYFVAVHHRNHLAVMTLNTVALTSAPTAIDFTTLNTATYGTNARKSVSGAFPAEVLWAGDVDFNNELKYTGSFNDRDPILLAIGGSIPTAVLSGQYRAEDVNMDASVKYVGANNDRDPILQNIGGSVPTNTRPGQLP